MMTNENNFVKYIELDSQMQEEMSKERINIVSGSLWTFNTGMWCTYFILVPNSFAGYAVAACTFAAAVQYRKFSNNANTIKKLNEEKQRISPLLVDSPKELPKVKHLERFHHLDGSITERRY